MNDENDDKAFTAIYMTMAYGPSWEQILENQDPEVAQRMKELARNSWLRRQIRIMTISAACIFLIPTMLMVGACMT